MSPRRRTWNASPARRLSRLPRHTGWGGSFGCGDLDRGLGIGYVHNQMGPDVTGDPRGISLCRAIYECI